MCDKECDTQLTIGIIKLWCVIDHTLRGALGVCGGVRVRSHAPYAEAWVHTFHFRHNTSGKR